MQSAKDHPDYVALRELVSSLVKSGNGTEEIRNKFGKVYGILLDEVIRDFIIEKNQVYILKDPAAIIAEQLQTDKFQWYGGPGSHSIRWNILKQNLINQNMSEEDLISVDSASTRVVSLLPSPASSSYSGRGLVLGYVQSGKTTNFLATLAKAADEGYRLIVVLSGTTNNLRNQTQFRLEKSLSNKDEIQAGQSWHWLTTAEHDFNVTANATNLLATPNTRVIAVVKKNKGRLTKLLKWLQQASETVRAEVPFLLIDDEADQATVNSSKRLNQQTAINKLVTQLLDVNLMPKNAYVGYTATPFANVLSDARDLSQIYPRDFILPLNKNTNYFGAEELFGREPLNENEQQVPVGRNIIREVTDPDIIPLGSAAFKNANHDSPVFTEALGRAMMWFLIATAVRRFRSKKIQFSTMLVHTSGPIGPHFKMQVLIQTELDKLRNGNLQDHAKVFRTLWEQEKDIAYFEGDGEQPRWNDLWPIIQQVTKDTKVIVDNYRSADRLNYDFENESQSKPTIVIGGNTLSRGLTLEGLISSFFLRTSTAYDSLLQMGRWFGYKPGYEDLQRIWMEEDLISLFKDLALVEVEIRNQIKDWAENGIRPDEVSIKIRTHASLNITAREKMLHAVRVQIGFSKQRVESIKFKNQAKWLEENLKSTENFIIECQKSGYVLESNRKNWPLFRDIPWSMVKEYLSGYNWVENSPKATLNLIVKYIEKVQSTKNELQKWNIFFYQIDQAVYGKRNLANIAVTRINRSALTQDDEFTNIHTLVSTIDGTADLPFDDDQIREKLPNKKFTDKSIIDFRQNYYGESKGLLGIYLIRKDSIANSIKRKDLNLVEDAVGLGFFFPNTSDQNAIIEYVAADLPEIAVSFDDNDLELLEEADTE